MKKTHEYLESLKTPGIFKITWRQFKSGNVCETRVQANGLVSAIETLVDARRDVEDILKWEKEQ